MKQSRSRFPLLIALCFLFCIGVSFDNASANDSRAVAPGANPQGSEVVSPDNYFEVGHFYNSRAVEESSFFFSSRVPLTLIFYGLPFWITDACIAAFNPFSGPFHFFWEGMFFGMLNLNALDILFGAGNGKDPEYMYLYFSVKDDHLLNNADGTSFYMNDEDIAMFDAYNGQFTRILDGKSRGVMGIDALAVYYGPGPESNGTPSYLFSTTHDSFLGNGPGEPPLFCNHEDLVIYNPATDKFEMFLYGIQDLGVNTLDAVDIEEEKLYFSVKEPVWVYKPPHTSVYLKDGDIACMDLVSKNGLELYFKGKPNGVYSLDGLSIGEFEE